MLRVKNFLINEQLFALLTVDCSGHLVGVRPDGSTVDLMDFLNLEIEDATIQVNELMEAVEQSLGLYEFRPENYRDPYDALPITDDEQEELEAAFDDGYRFFAKDSTGQVYVYHKAPVKGEQCWQAQESDSINRLHGLYAALDFEGDDDPAAIEDYIDAEN